ncbi:hypothetical protein PS943_01494 [Pseudomonas fluorescens]|uniref:Uncharacterized protein n=1 Tax=Pseudomonas fluorescens TaxID=294 RepID=A0A5E7W559_PSEFL|nr:hypothetical protein [Pseudomonas fluorescens]VVQ29765.1 hypothetical protein PS943_01494 [Pseudomonas fluorescens]
MNLQKFEKPINRFGFVVFCVSMVLCLIAFFVSYRSYYSLSLERLAYLILDSSTTWQQTLFKLGCAGAFIGAAFTWNYLDKAKRVYQWVVKTEEPRGD